MDQRIVLYKGTYYYCAYHSVSEREMCEVCIVCVTQTGHGGGTGYLFLSYSYLLSAVLQ